MALKSRVGKKRRQDMDHTRELIHHLAIVPCLVLKHCGDGFDRITIFELLGERMVGQSHPGLLFIALQGSLEER